MQQTIANCRTVFEADNIVVINMPPNTEGKLVQSDIDHLMEIADGLGIRRTTGCSM